MQDEKVDIKLDEKQIKLRKKKVEFMLQWTTVFYPQEHRAVMSYLGYKYLSTIPIEKVDSISDPHLWKVKNIQNLLADLRNGFLVCTDEARLERGQKQKTAWVNFHFFAMYQDIVQELNDQLKPQYETLKKNIQGQVRKRCRNCGVMRPESELNFFGPKCDCTNPSFEVVSLNQDKKKRYHFILEVLNGRFFKMKNEIDILQNQAIQNRKRIKQESGKTPNPFQQFLKKNEVDMIRPDLVLRAANIERLRAANLYGRKPKIHFKEDLIAIRQIRNKREYNNFGDFKLQQ